MKLLPFRVGYRCSIFNLSRWINSSNVYRHTTDIYYDDWGYHCHGNKWVWRTPIIDIYIWVRSSYLLVQRKIFYQFIYVHKSIYNLVSMLYYRYGTIYIVLSIPSDNKCRLIELSMLYHDTTVLSSYLCYITILPSYRVIYVILRYYRLIELSMLYHDTTVLSSFLCYITILPSYPYLQLLSVLYCNTSYQCYIAIRSVLSVLYCNTYRLIGVILQYVPSYRSYFTIGIVLSMLYYNKFSLLDAILQ